MAGTERGFWSLHGYYCNTNVTAALYLYMGLISTFHNKAPTLDSTYLEWPTRQSERTSIARREKED